MTDSDRKSSITVFLKGLFRSFIPNRRDNIRQIIIKILFLISLITLIVSATYLGNYFLTSTKQKGITEASRKIWNSDSVTTADKFENLIAENPDFMGWITINGTLVDNPFYQTDNNEYYLSHNQRKEPFRLGAVFLSCDDRIDKISTDKNLTLFGHDTKDGSMFGTLRRLRKLSFYKQNPVISLSTRYDDSVYKIYAIFLLNADKADDNNYIYNIARDSFSDKEEFDEWSKEAYQRSIIDTGVDVSYGDDILSLVTCCDDFNDARLVVMARKTRTGESAGVDTTNAVVNASARYPKRWYDDRKLDYPY